LLPLIPLWFYQCLERMRAFISYSHKDADLLTKLHEHLAGLKRQNLITTWTDREISAGGVIDAEVAKAMDDADLYLLLVSAAFIESNYCYDREFARALARQKTGESLIVPIIIRDCDWALPELRQFKALPDDGKAVTSRHWHTPDEAFTNVASGLRALVQRRKPSETAQPKRQPAGKFVPNESHVTDDEREVLRKLCDEVVQRLTVKTVFASEAEAKRKKGKYFGIVWAQFNERFGIPQLAALERTRFAEARSWFQQYRASKDKKFKRINPQKYRDTLTKTIHTIGGTLGWSRDQIHAFSAAQVGYAAPVTSLNDLGNQQLELVRDRIRFESTKRKVASGQPKARHAGKQSHAAFGSAMSDEARSLLLKMAEARDGGVMRSESHDGYALTVGHENFVESTSERRTKAKWERALRELEDAGLIETNGPSGDLFALTDEGYKLADTLKIVRASPNSRPPLSSVYFQPAAITGVSDFFRGGDGLIPESTFGEGPLKIELPANPPACVRLYPAKRVAPIKSALAARDLAAQGDLRPMGLDLGGRDWSRNAMGAIAYAGPVDTNLPGGGKRPGQLRNFTQLFLSGELCGADFGVVGRIRGHGEQGEIKRTLLYTQRFELSCALALRDFLRFSRAMLEQPAPVHVEASLRGILGAGLDFGRGPRGNALAPDVVWRKDLDSHDCDPCQVLRPFFEEVWENFGIRRNDDAHAWLVRNFAPSQ
jgi:hypothetical protein